MAPWSFMRINYVPIVLGLVLGVGLLLCFLIAVLRGDVSPYLPFISETGGIFPEAGIFSIFLYLSSVLMLSTTIMRYGIVREMNRGIDRVTDILNRVSTVIAIIATMGMVVVAAYPMTSIGTAHAVGANVLFLGGVVYAILQTVMSYKMSPYYCGKRICHIRLVITVLSALAVIALIVIQPIANSEWYSTKHKHWTGGKTPKDQGFDLLLASSISEWTLAILFVSYYFTFVKEFSKVWIHLEVQLLVEHFDDEPGEQYAAIATERTPIVM